MKIVRYKTSDAVNHGVLENNLIFSLKNSIYDDNYIFEEKGVNVKDVKLLAPCEPSKIICLGLNYRDHAEEMDILLPKWPIIFMKPSTAVIGNNENIVYPVHLSKRVDYEAELAVVIKKKAKDVKIEESDNYILGYTCGNDVTARDLQPKDGQWDLSKSFDSFLPLGPVISADMEPDNLEIKCLVNGEIKQSSNTKNLIFNVPYLVSYLSHVMTLLPGDVILTGTSSGIGPLALGDKVTVSIEGIGKLTNTVIEDTKFSSLESRNYFKKLNK
jgi:2-keto-4-pentenoate hydratase/2-oxohepta-3-ene-1,7-dioic acid hydratase in catechol pathway